MACTGVVNVKKYKQLILLRTTKISEMTVSTLLAEMNSCQVPKDFDQSTEGNVCPYLQKKIGWSPSQIKEKNWAVTVILDNRNKGIFAAKIVKVLITIKSDE